MIQKFELRSRPRNDHNSERPSHGIGQLHCNQLWKESIRTVIETSARL